MSRVVYLNALQALDAALRHGSMKRASLELGITPAAVGQRIRTLEAFTGTQMLERGQSGVTATPAAKAVESDLRRAFGDLDQVAMRLNLDRDGPVRVLCDSDFLTFWLRPRLAGLDAEFPGLKLAFLADGDPAPPDLIVRFGGPGEVLLPEWLVPVVSPENLLRVGQVSAEFPLEGMPLLHVGPATGLAHEHGWPDWVARFPLRKSGADRGFRYNHVADALNFAAADVGMALLPLALCLSSLQSGALVRLFPHLPLMPARNAWMIQLTDGARDRTNLRFVVDWLRTQSLICREDLSDPRPGDDLVMEFIPMPR